MSKFVTIDIELQYNKYILSSSEDEDFENVIYRRPKIIRQRPSYLEEFDDVDFHARFRLSKDSVITVLAEIEQEISHKTELSRFFWSE